MELLMAKEYFNDVYAISYQNLSYPMYVHKSTYIIC